MRIFWPNCREVEEGEITEAQRNTIDHLRQEYDLTDNIQIEREFGSLRGALEDVILMRVEEWNPDIGLVWFDGEIAGDGHVHTRNQGVVNLKGEGGRWRIDQRSFFNSSQ